MVGLVGLNDGQAGHPTPTGAADSLREQLISPFGGAFLRPARIHQPTLSSSGGFHRRPRKTKIQSSQARGYVS